MDHKFNLGDTVRHTQENIDGTVVGLIDYSVVDTGVEPRVEYFVFYPEFNKRQCYWSVEESLKKA